MDVVQKLYALLSDDWMLDQDAIGPVDEAATEITRLREENKRMREALDVSKAIAWAEKDGDEWLIHDANSKLGKHITEWQTAYHYKSLFPVFKCAALATTGGE